MNDSQLRAQARTLGVPFDKWNILHRMGIPSGSAKKLAEYTLPLLLKAMARITGAELLQMEGIGEYGLDVYLKLRKFLTHDEADGVRAARKSEAYLAGLKANIAFAELKRVDESGIDLAIYVDTYGSDITLEQLAEVKSANASLSQYVDMRRDGYSHEDLIGILSLGGESDGYRRGVDNLDNYRILRENGTTHDQIVAVRQLGVRSSNHYVELRIKEVQVQGQAHKLARCSDVSHELAMQALTFGSQYARYVDARKTYTHEQISEVVEAGLEIEKYIEFRANNCRVNHDEVVQYAQLSQFANRLHGINSYLILLDAGISFEQVMEVIQAGGSVATYLWLQRAAYECSHEQVLELVRLGEKLGVVTYLDLRADGISHDDIITGVTDLTLPVE